jgi:hypothetical protein
MNSPKLAFVGCCSDGLSPKMTSETNPPIKRLAKSFDDNRTNAVAMHSTTSTNV